MGTVNFSQVIIAECSSILLLLFLVYTRVDHKENKKYGEIIFDGVMWVTISSALIELIGFYLDGKPGKLNHVVLYILDGYLLIAATVVGYFWCLYAYIRIYQSIRFVKRRAIPLGIPTIIIIILVFLDFTGADLLFRITEDNVYERGPLGILLYIFLVCYLFYTVGMSHYARFKGEHIVFFPVLCFVLPCILGTVIQGLFYGIATSWFGVSIAIVLIYMQLQNRNSFVDELSGLFNRKYFQYYTRSLKQDTYGIMLDVNGFKEINDSYGHTVGDVAIRDVSRILMESVSSGEIVIRFAGDEFIILVLNNDEEYVNTIINTINSNLSDFNQTRKRQYKLSLSMGYCQYRLASESLDDFIRRMDQQMYAAKARYYEENGYDRRK